VWSGFIWLSRERWLALVIIVMNFRVLAPGSYLVMAVVYRETKY
jgi:hypothetical protein